MRKVPEIRFAGFDGEWEEKKISTIAKFSKGKGYSKNDLTNGKYPIYLYGQMYTNYKSQINEVETYTDSIKVNSILSKGNEVLIPSSGETAEDLARASHMNISNVLLGGDLNIIEPNDGVNSHFLALELSNGSVKQSLSKKAQGKSVVHLYNTDIKNQKINYPVIEEQEKIGDLFKKIDDLIEIQEGKVAKMEDLKKSMLQKMFPKKDELVPEFRFDGFEGGWNTKALGDLSEISTGKLDANAMVPGGEYDFYTSGIEKYKIDNYAFEGPSITVAGNGATVGYMHLADGKFNAYQRTYVIQKIKGDRIFIFYQIQSKLPRKIHEESRQGNIPYIVMNMLTDLYLDVPEIEEQEKIGQFFKNLDTQIENEEKLLESYKCMKKSLLQKMFV
ncbi:restriction endonuclease subunit S [uncultured Anaerococcus sp.]|uniref:restriction endonuclease subunit S n=1 Tax=uncultured Anaerococcus sp. TaxID=293428 RepID=UPI002627BAC1|nr:restriction endonuclease subunit S [uncultured Anaerococcus sp.]